jgi:hypothetical protein
MRHRIRSVVLALALLTPAFVAAQETGPPKFLQITREVVKPGKDLAHSKSEVSWSRALEAAKYPATSLGMSALSGPNEMWWLTGYGAMADIQKVSDAVEASPALTAVGATYGPPEADFVSNTIGMIARFRDDLSYNNSVPMTSERFMVVGRVVVRTGMGEQFTEARKIIKAAHEKAKAADGFAIYQVMVGAPAGTFLIFQPRKSLGEFDTDPHAGPAYVAAIGGPEGQKKLMEMQVAYQASSSSDLFKLDPAISVLDK